MSFFGNLFSSKPTLKRSYSYLENELRSPIKERHDFALEFILHSFAPKTFEKNLYLRAEYQRIGGIENTKSVIEKLEKCICKTSVSLRELVQDNYHDFIECFSQIRDIEQTFGCKHNNLQKMMQKMSKILRYQEAICFDFDFVKWEESLLCNVKQENNVNIPGNDIVDSPSLLIDEICATIDEKKWKDAIKIVNMLSQDLYRGEYAYLKAATRKQIKRKIIAFRKKIFDEISNLLLMNAYNKLYRHRLTVYILKIQKNRYFVRGIRLFLRCKLKELHKNMQQLHLSYDLRAHVTDFTILCFHTIRELISEFNAILVESGHYKSNKDAMSFLTVFILSDILLFYVRKFKNVVFEAAKCEISLKAMGECLRISYGYFNKLKWNGLYLEMHLNDYLFSIICDSLRLYFEEQTSESAQSLANDSFQIKEISLFRSQTKKRRKFQKYEAVITDHVNENVYANEKEQKKMKIFITSSCQFVYDQIRHFLADSRSLLSFSYYPIMSAQIMSVLAENVIKFLQIYCSNITQILREWEERKLGKRECIAMISNTFYVAKDLLHRINEQMQTKKTERIESFKKKMIVLYKEQIKYFSKTLSIKYVFEILCFYDCIPEYYDDDNENEVVGPSEPWMLLMNQISKINELCTKYMNENAAKLMISGMANTIILQLNDAKYWNSETDKNKISFCGLQQFIFDTKLFAFSMSNLLNDESKSIAFNLLINGAIKLYHDTNTNEQRNDFIIIKSNQWYSAKIDAFFHLHPHLNLNMLFN